MSNENIKEEWRDFRSDYRNNRIPTGVLLVLKTKGKNYIGFFNSNSTYYVSATSTTSMPIIDSMLIDEYKIIDMNKIGE